MKVKSLMAPIFAALVVGTAWASPIPASAAGDVQLNGSGATFPQPLYEDWAYIYSTTKDPSVKINYAGGGSGKGKTDIINGTVDFAGTDAPLTDGEAARTSLVQIPSVAGAVVAAYNLSGVKTLTLDGDTLGKIYAGRIQKWNDPAIKKLNPGVNLPNLPIIVVHRSDGSGTTNVFTRYLTKASKDWTDTVKPSYGTTVDWPVDKLKRGLGGQGNQGVAAAVQKTRGAIGYIELAYANNNKIPYSKMINAAGKTVDPNMESIIAAQEDAVFNKRLQADIMNSKQPNAWPIAGYTYLLVPKDIKDCTKAQRLIQWINWGIASEEGKARSARLIYAPLPASIVPTVGLAIKTITCNNGNSVF